MKSILPHVSVAAEQEIGRPLRPWSSGTLDIHHMNTGRGDAALCILPDGTSMLIDAGANVPGNPRHTDPRPDDSRTPGEWVSRYVLHMLPGQRRALDYAVVTHFHGDHVGEVTAESRPSRSGEFRLTGISEVGEHVSIRKIIDRGWSDYSYPEPLDDSGDYRFARVQNYRAFLQYHRSQGALEVERFRPGVNDQIRLLGQPEGYPGFEVRNIAANGEVWTGVGSNTRKIFPPLDSLERADYPTENMCSIALRISYGPFDYFTGGDLVGVPKHGVAPAWQDVETPVAQAVGPVDVSVATHHGYCEGQNAFLVASLRPRVHILQVWGASHPSPSVLWRLLSTRLYPGPRDIFATNMMEANRIVIGSNIDKLKSQQGHILLRVEPGGHAYRVVILDDSAETFRVTAVHGPYLSR